MPSGTNLNTVLSDYSAMAECLFLIQAQEPILTNPEVQGYLLDFEKDISTLFGQTLRVLGIIDRVDNITADYLIGDFEADDFSDADFHTGYLNTRNTGYSSRFQTILNVFQYFSERWNDISAGDKGNLDIALTAVLNAFNDLQNHLTLVGLNPCIPPESSYFNNSPALYLQAAGSDGKDGTPAGVHLRWSLAGDLGSNHFPKGILSAVHNETTYNQPDDFVQLYRTPYNNPVQLTLDFQKARPAIDLVTKRWTYALSLTINNNVTSTRIFVSFKDLAKYNQLSTAAPDPYYLLNAYDGIIELEISNKTAFAISFEFKKGSTGTGSKLKLEALSSTDVSLGSASETVTIRKSVNVNTADAVRASMSGESLHRIRIKKPSGINLQSFFFETYSDFVASKSESDWTKIENVSGLAVDDLTVFDRLENPRYTINKLWPHFNDGATVRVDNYKDKWMNTRSSENNPSIKEVVNKYLNLSSTDPRAIGTVRDAGTDTTSPGLDISYLDILNLMALDYHIARMLGLGYIDTFNSDDKFVYKVRYSNRKSINSTVNVVHEYLSLPTGKKESRLPLIPDIRPVTYKLPGSNELNDNIFDVKGYASVADVRIVNIGRELFSDEVEDDYFKDTTLAKDINIFEHVKPVLYGVEYCPPGETEFKKPEITSDKFSGHHYYSYDAGSGDSGQLETIPVPDNLKSLYVHFVKKSGVHKYAIYGINWFSRASQLSEKAVTDETIFPIKNTFLPPVDVAVQYIQKEDPLLFTTATEQEWLKFRTETFGEQDVSFTRITFNWLDIIDISDRALSSIIKPDTIKAYFKHDQPIEIKGIIVNLTPVPGINSRLLVQTGNYTLLNATSVDSSINNTDFNKFTDSVLSTAEGHFRVVAVSGAEGRLLTIEKARVVETVKDPDDDGRFGTREIYTSPEVGSRFTLMENLSNPVSWEAISASIKLVAFGNPITETTTDEEENETKYLIGGITGNAIITSLPSMRGFYSIAYHQGVSLKKHPQTNLPTDANNSPDALRRAHVEWYKGFVRVETNKGTDKKLLEVLRIETDITKPLTLYAYDPTYDLNSQDPNIKESPSSTVFVNNVNFHPSYKAYLFSEPLPAAFNRSNIHPGAQENDKRTLIGLQSADTSPRGFSSRVSSPSILLARKMEEPVQPTALTPVFLRVRPDATGKAAFTFDTEIKLIIPSGTRNPFGFMFYRTTNEDLLYALYNPDTVSRILHELDAIEEDSSYDQRYLELTNAEFKVLNAKPTPYGFPVPDKTGLTEAEDSPDDKQRKYRAAIRGTLLPLAEQTPLFAFIKPGKQTENKLASMRDIDGNLLDPSLTNPGFDPFPMVRKYEENNETYIRFTDYTLNASSRFLYFYSCSEITVQLTPGPLSPFIGPVYILNTHPAEAPVIRSFTVESTVNLTESKSKVTFYLMPFSVHDNISKIRIYRTFDQTKAVSLSTMTSSINVAIDGDAEIGTEVIDTFSDLKQMPLGETIYYRLATVRTIMNETNQPEEVLSLGSGIIVVKLIDAVNPSPPVLSYSESANELSWQPTATKATYYLFKQNARGNWEKIVVLPNGDTGLMSYKLPAILDMEDEDGDRIYHRFKVKVENSSGLFNLVDNELTI